MIDLFRLVDTCIDIPIKLVFTNHESLIALALASIIEVTCNSSSMLQSSDDVISIRVEICIL